MRLRQTPGERRRSEQLRTLPPLALEFSRIMGEVFGASAKTLPDDELKARRVQAAVLATKILDDIDQLRWDQTVTPEMRRLLEATRRKMLSDKRIKGLLTDAGPLTAP